MHGTQLHLAVLGVEEVQAGALAGLVRVIDGGTDGYGCCCAGVGRAEVECETLEYVCGHVVLIYDGDVARWALGALEVGTGWGVLAFDFLQKGGGGRDNLLRNNKSVVDGGGVLNHSAAGNVA